MIGADDALPVSYTPGPHLLLVAPGCVLLLGADAEKAWDCWPLVRDGADTDDLLDAILLVGLRSIGSFGLVRRSAKGLRIVVRGEVVVTTQDQVIAATPEQSWVDTMLPTDTSLTMGTGSVDETLPLVLGAARAAAVQVGEDAASGQRVPVVALAPVAAPEELPEHEVPIPQDVEPVDDPASPIGVATVEPTAQGEPGQTISRTAPFEPDTGFDHTASWTDDVDEPSRPVLIDSMPFALNLPEEPPALVDAPRLHRFDPGIASADQPVGGSPTDVEDATIKRGSIGHELRVPDASNPLVLAVRCAAGHLSPGFVATCRVCGSLVDAQTPIEVMRPILGQLRLSTGDVVTLDRGAVMGRSPSVPEGSAEVPHLIKLGTHDTDLSRNHLEVTLDGWHVVVTDLGSKNGSVVTRPGATPERLRAHESQIIEPGTTVSLADVISFRFEATQ
jgi:hypothetical protein